MKKHNISLVILPLVIMVCLGGGIWIGSFLGKGSHKSLARQKLETVLGLIATEYVDTIDIDSLLEGSIPDILSYLDPHSAYIPKEELQAVTEDLDGSFSGVGVSFQILNDTIVVVEVIPDGPAEKAGIKAGDRIVKVDGKNMASENISNEDVFKSLRGERQTHVRLEVVRPFVSTPLTFDVTRNDVPVTSIDAHYIISPGIGYVKVGKFSRNTYAEFMSAVEGLKGKGARKLIIDLRGNGGGLMDQAISMANEFLPEGRLIVYTRARTETNRFRAESNGGGTLQDVEIAVVTNEYSASASEIFAGAIQDNDRGLVIGRRSFGKGLVQNQIMLPDSSAIRLTVARYYTPSGRSIQKEYKRGADGKYDLDLAERYTHGEFYNIDSIKLDKSNSFKTAAGRTVYGGGGIMPDIFVPEDTTNFTSYYLDVVNNGLLQKYAFGVADNYRSILKGVSQTEKLLQMIPRDAIMLNNFANYGAANGVPARWYYINKSAPLILRQIKAFIARDILGFNDYIKVLNSQDPTILRALEALENGESPVNIKSNTTKQNGEKGDKKKN